VLYLLAVLWQISNTKKRALNRCHFIAPARNIGRAADLGALGNGFRHGRYCVASCWLTMMPLSVTKLGLFSMAVIF
jgi:predicted metal-binding membrane protein